MVYWISALLLMVSTTVHANAAVTVSVPAVQKAYSNWCWAACAEMAGKNIYHNSWYDQYSVVAMIKGSGNPNVGANAYETASGCTIVANSIKNFTVYNNTFSQSQIQNYINSGYALAAITGNPYGTLSLHDIIIYGYETKNGIEHLFIIDPDTGVGSEKTRASLIDGTWKPGYSLPYFSTIYPN